MKNDAQKQFENHCSEHLDMRHHLPIAQQVYREAYEAEPNQVKKENVAGRVMNQYLYAQLKAIGWQNWKPDEKGNKPKRVTPQQGKLTDSERAAVAHKASKEMPKGMGIKLDW
jgi:hypothetical protein